MESRLQEEKAQRPRVWASVELPLPKALVALSIGMMAAASSLLLTTDNLKFADVAVAFAIAWAAMIDVDRFKLPDAITLPLTGFGLLFAAMRPESLLNHLAGAVVAFSTLAIVAIIYRKVRNRDGLGMGDAKFFAAAGAWLGLPALPFVMLASATAALAWIALLGVLRREISADRAIAFGPFLALGFWAVWLAETIPRSA
jgi:leader peptidase (prepilin peptidase)/N-methyltransferase